MSLPPSIFNDILGPVMRGPSSSHTAGSYHIAVLTRALLGRVPSHARVVFDPGGSYGRVYREQGVDLAFAAGLLGWELTDARFPDALEAAGSSGLDLAFGVEGIEGADHPNTVEVELRSEGGLGLSGDTLRVRAKSVGGGAVEITRVDGWPARLRGETYAVVVVAGERAIAEVREILADGEARLEPRGAAAVDSDQQFLIVSRVTPLSDDRRRSLDRLTGVVWREIPPTAFAKHNAPLFTSAGEMVAAAEARGWSLGRIAMAYESALVGLDDTALAAEMGRRFEIMREAVRLGLRPTATGLQLLRPTAGAVIEAERAGRVAIGGLHTRAAARAMAVMHTNGAMGVVCAAPTGGSAGVLPGVVVSLVEELGLGDDVVLRALFAASAIGVVVAMRATFAAEVAGCQVEIGAAGAMAAAAVVDAFGGSARQACDAAAIAFQNTMGSVCDLVQGRVEIPCHTRNAVAASSAFVCADLVMGGYENPIPLDETIDAVYAVGRMMPVELRCTARGGLAVTPSALALGGG